MRNCANCANLLLPIFQSFLRRINIVWALLILGVFSLIKSVFTRVLGSYFSWCYFLLVLLIIALLACLVSGVQVFSVIDQINFCFLVCWGGAGACGGGGADLLLYAPTTWGDECESESYVSEGHRVRKSLFDGFDNENAKSWCFFSHNYFAIFSLH